jgi:hypothetical protein
VKRVKKGPRSAAAAAGVIFQLVFLFAAVTPRAVWCHRPGGETVLEFEIVPGECRCDQCVLCRERGRREQAGIPSPGPVMRGSHCVHNEVDSEAGRTSGSLQSPSKACSAGPHPSAAHFAGIPDPSALRPASLQRCRDNDPGPPSATALRC